MEPKDRKVLILGAGVAGLTLGAKLAAEGFPVELYEEAAEVGGLSRSFEKVGFVFDIGPHIYFENELPFYRELVGDAIHRVEGVYGVGYRRRQITTPIRPLDLLRTLPILESLRLVSSLAVHRLVASRKQPTEFRNVDEVISARFGERVNQAFFRDYIPKVMGFSAREVHPDWFLERERFYQQHNLWGNVVKNVVSGLVRLAKEQPEPRKPLTFYYPREGAGSLCRALAARIESLGGRIFPGRQVTEIQLDRGKVVRVRGTGRDGAWEACGDTVASTLPVTTLLATLDSAEDPNLAAAAAGGLRYTHLRVFCFVLRRARLSDKIQIYFPEKRYLFKRIYETKNLEPEMGGPCRTGICIEVTYLDGDHVDEMREAEVYGRLVAELGDFYGVAEDEIEDFFSVRVRNCYSAYAWDYRTPLSQAARGLGQISNLYSFGRSGLYRYNYLTDRVLECSEALFQHIRSGKSKTEALPSGPDAKSVFF